MDDWGDTYQLVQPNAHQRNTAERAIHTFKAHFLSVIAGVDPSFTKFIWDNLLSQKDITINLIHQATLNPRISAWEYLKGALDYAATPLDPIGCKIIIHTTSKNRKFWDQRGRKWFSVEPALHHYRCIQAIYSKAKSLLIKYTAKYFHEYLTQPSVTAEDRMMHSIYFLYAALKDVPKSICNSQLAAIEAFRNLTT